jgi:hypothetical protein
MKKRYLALVFFLLLGAAPAAFAAGGPSFDLAGFFNQLLTFLAFGDEEFGEESDGTTIAVPAFPTRIPAAGTPLEIRSIITRVEGGAVTAADGAAPPGNRVPAGMTPIQ